jgi:tetratricopeptide (TPR) repeat protein
VLDAHESLRREAEDPGWVGFPTTGRTRYAAFQIFRVDELEEMAGFLPLDNIGSRAEILASGTPSPLMVGFGAGEYRRSLALFEESAGVALRWGALLRAALDLGVGARVHLALGDLTSADAWHARAMSLAERAGNPPYAALQLLGHPVERRWLVERLEGFAPVADALRPTVDEPAIENRWVAAPTWAFAAYANAVLGRSELALGYLERARRAIELGRGQAPNYTFMICWAAAAVWELGHADWAPLIERQLLGKTIAGDFRYPSTDARLAMAWMCALQGRHDEASAWFAKARAVLDEQGARPLRAITDLEEARMLARRGAPGDRERALPLLDAALGGFEAIGMPGWIRCARALRGELGGR